ncbi:MAG: winged helix DNA-binding protein [Caldithrix sp.]|nr:winged helix DNA-binding protein [Caldithrix sp.]
MKEVWRKFDEVELTHSSVHHLMAMHELLKSHGYVRGIDIANYLDISRSSVSITMKKLLNKGYITEDENKFYRFTEHGEELINSVLSKRRIIRTFFHKALNLPETLAESEACKIEHLLEEETGQRLMSFMGFFLSEGRAAREFRNQFQSFTYHCNQFDECEVCELECYFAGEKPSVNV